MNDYRPLTSEEIEALQQNDCWAEDWTSVNVAEDFQPEFMHHVMMYGEVNIGSFNKMVNIDDAFQKHSGIRNATLANVTIGDDCLIENISDSIRNYDIGNETYISNIGVIKSAPLDSFGEGNHISVLSEAGEGNIMLFSGLTAPIAAYMLIIEKDKEAKMKLYQTIQDDINNRVPARGMIGDYVRITNTKEISGCVIQDYCDIANAEILTNCTLLGDCNEGAYVGTGVILENCIIGWDSTIDNAANLTDCFVGEYSLITDGFTAQSSLFFANSTMANGEACAAFCGPYAVSHHKGSLLIGGYFSFFNAGSSTNFSNHAYKMGPIHWGTLERGCKTASGAYLFMPVHIGAYTVCLGKTMTHPDTSLLPFSYLIGKDEKTILKPGRNLTTAGLYRDINKWPKRDHRHIAHCYSGVNKDWISTFIAQKLVRGKKLLQQLILNNGDEADKEYTYGGVVISNHDAHIGIEYYDAALKMYMKQALCDAEANGVCDINHKPIDMGDTITDWLDLGGMITSANTMSRFNENLKNGKFKDMASIQKEFKNIHYSYIDLEYPFAYLLILAYYHIEQITEQDAERIKQEGEKAKKWWLGMIEQDAKKEFALGDVDEDTYNKFIANLWEGTEQDKALGADHPKLSTDLVI